MLTTSRCGRCATSACCPGSMATATIVHARKWDSRPRRTRPRGATRVRKPRAPRRASRPSAVADSCKRSISSTPSRSSSEGVSGRPACEQLHGGLLRRPAGGCTRRVPPVRRVGGSPVATCQRRSTPATRGFLGGVGNLPRSVGAQGMHRSCQCLDHGRPECQRPISTTEYARPVLGPPVGAAVIGARAPSCGYDECGSWARRRPTCVVSRKLARSVRWRHRARHGRTSTATRPVAAPTPKTLSLSSSGAIPRLPARRGARAVPPGAPRDD